MYIFIIKNNCVSNILNIKIFQKYFSRIKKYYPPRITVYPVSFKEAVFLQVYCTEKQYILKVLPLFLSLLHTVYDSVYVTGSFPKTKYYAVCINLYLMTLTYVKTSYTPT